MLNDEKINALRRIYDAAPTPDKCFLYDVMSATSAIWIVMLEQIAQIRGANALIPLETKPEPPQKAASDPESEPDWADIAAELEEDYA